MSAELPAMVRASPGGSWLRFLWWHMVRFPFWVAFKLFYFLSVSRRDLLPREGPTLIVANHESFLDPVIIGLSTGLRPMHSLARSTLYHNFFFGWMIRSVNAIPVERGTADIGSMRRCIEVLQQGKLLALFPEGTRSETGDIAPFKPGVLLLIKRAKPKVVPMAITGSLRAWPKGKKIPRLFKRVRAKFGEPIDADKLLAMGNDGALEHLRMTIVKLKEEMEGRS
ncbi:MAG: lysophospholipid acyltransferase family protein [Phycisphaeraceae bacterium]